MLVSNEALLGIALVELGLVIVPGPNMIYLIARSIAQGRRAGLISLTGVGLGFLTYLLAASAGQIVTRDEILDALWGSDFVSESNVVDSDYGAPAGTGINQRHTSYGGCQGTWSIEILPQNQNYAAQVANAIADWR